MRNWYGKKAEAAQMTIKALRTGSQGCTTLSNYFGSQLNQDYSRDYPRFKKKLEKEFERTDSPTNFAGV